jgi:hypothetical protein
MPKQTLFAYVQGTDLDDVLASFEARFDALVASRKWRLGDVWVVNQRTPETGKATEWDLGFNLTLPAKKTRPDDWIEDLVAIATTFGELQRETKRSFVIGIHDSKTDTTQDLFFVDSDAPDLEKLRAAVSAATAK